MLRKVKRSLCLIMSAIVLMVFLPVNVSAATEVGSENSDVAVLDAEVRAVQGEPEFDTYSTTFSAADISISFSAKGMLVEIYTSMTRTASTVGVKDIKIWKKGFLGIWTVVAESAGGGSSNVMGSSCTVLYPGAVKGETYKVTCTHYGDTDGYRELPNETSGVVCVY